MIRSWLLCIISCFSSIPSLYAETTLRVGFDEYCPYTCLKGEHKGFVIDILEQILPPRGFKLEYVSASWPRIKSMAQKGSIDLLVPVNQIETKELGIARTRNSINTFHEGSMAAYFVHKDSKWTYSGRESLQDQIIGIVQGYTYPEPLRSHLQNPQFKNKQIVLASDQSNQRHIKMLASQRITVLPSERIVFWYIAGQLGLEKEFKDAGVLEMPDELAHFYIGVVQQNKPLAANLLQWLDQGIGSLKNSARLKNILQKYGCNPLISP